MTSSRQRSKFKGGHSQMLLYFHQSLALFAKVTSILGGGAKSISAIYYCEEGPENITVYLNR